MPHRPSWPLRRGTGAVLLLLFALFFPSCEDEHGTVNDPETPPIGPDSDFIYATTVFSTAVFQVQNMVIDLLRGAVATRADFPMEISGRGGSLTIDEIAEDVFQLTFTNFNDPSISQLLELINGSMIVSMEETDPGLSYTINPGEDDFLPFGLGPHFLVYQLPSAIGATLAVSGTVHGELDDSAARHEGFVHETGTLRIEDPTARFLFILRLGIEYEFDAKIFPSFSQWPVGAYEVGIFGEGSPITPFIVSFDGDGGASFPYRGHNCDVDLNRPIDDLLDDLGAGNPCSGF